MRLDGLGYSIGESRASAWWQVVHGVPTPANVDAIVGRTKSTLDAHASLAARMNCRELNKSPLSPPRGPFPDHECIGMGIAVDWFMNLQLQQGTLLLVCTSVLLDRLGQRILHLDLHIQRTARGGTFCQGHWKSLRLNWICLVQWLLAWVRIGRVMIRWRTNLLTYKRPLLYWMINIMRGEYVKIGIGRPFSYAR